MGLFQANIAALECEANALADEADKVKASNPGDAVVGLVMVEHVLRHMSSAKCEASKALRRKQNVAYGLTEDEADTERNGE